MSKPCVFLEFTNEPLRVYIDAKLTELCGKGLYRLDDTHYLIACDRSEEVRSFQSVVDSLTQEYFDTIVYDKTAEKSTERGSEDDSVYYGR